MLYLAICNEQHKYIHLLFLYNVISLFIYPFIKHISVNSIICYLIISKDL